MRKRSEKRAAIEPPLSPPSGAVPHACPRCNALIIGHLVSCPNCSAALTYSHDTGGVARASGPQEFGCLKALAAATLTITAFIAGLIGAVLAFAGAGSLAGSSAESTLALMLLGIALSCFCVVAVCIIGLKALFQKRP